MELDFKQGVQKKSGGKKKKTFLSSCVNSRNSASHLELGFVWVGLWAGGAVSATTEILAPRNVFPGKGKVQEPQEGLWQVLGRWCGEPGISWK